MLLRRSIVATIIFLILLSFPISLFADDYTLPIVVDGQPYTLTVSVDDDGITVASDSTEVEIGDLVAIEPPYVPQKAIADAITCKDILDNQRDMTRAQWLNYIESSVKTRTLVGWEGEIDEVGGKGLLTLGEFPLHISVKPGCRIYYTESDEETALSYDEGQKVSISGEITDLVVVLGTPTLYVDDSSFSLEEIASQSDVVSHSILDGDGFYTVGTEIDAGLWETEAGYTFCYWALLDEDQEILKNHLGASGGMILVSETAYELELRGCGSITQVTDGYLREKKETSQSRAPKDDGFYTVGVEIAAGTWETENGFDSCYWSLLDENQDILKNHFGPSGGSIRITDQSFELQITDCGELTPVSIHEISKSDPDPDSEGGNTDNSADNGSTANRNANLRGGPGTNFPVVASVSTGDLLDIVARDVDATWVQLSGGEWIATFLVDGLVSAENLPEAEDIPEAPAATDDPASTSSVTPQKSPGTYGLWEEIRGNGWLFNTKEVHKRKTVYLYGDPDVAMGHWVIVILDAVNEQSGSDHFANNVKPYLVDEAGNTYTTDAKASAYAQWQFEGLSSPYSDVDPGKLARIAMAFDVPDGAGNLLLSTDLPARVALGNFDQMEVEE